jgi:4-hydroxymandelate oxidase
VAQACGPGALWFQLYPQPDLAFTEALVRRAEAAGCRALVVTADSPVFGRRPRDLRNGFGDLPPGLACENLRDPVSGTPRPIAMDDTLGWDRLARLRAATRLPIVLKGVLHPADARLAVEHGLDAVLVSNHGGRQLDGAPATLEVLPDVVAAVAGRVPVLLDGGVRRGVDVLVALALGADAVAVGRPVLWGLAAAGEAGVRAVLELLRAELDAALALAGARRPADLTPDLVVPR